MAVPVAAVSSALGTAITRLIELVDEENSLLLRQQVLSHSGYTDRKNQALRELLIAQRREMTDVARSDLRPALQQLSAVLQVNARLLKHHIAAVGEVSDIIVGSLKDADSDGTYSRSSRMQGWR